MNATITTPKRSTSVEMAVQQILADVDTFMDDLSAACFNRTKVSSDFYLRQPGRLVQADDATLMHAALVAADAGDAETCCNAMRLLTARHIERKDEAVQRLAAEIDRDSEQHQLEARLGRLPRTLKELAA